MGKGRLSGALNDAARAALGIALAARTAGTVLESGMTPLMVAGDDEMRAWAERKSIALIPDPGEGLNGAADAGVGWCRDRSMDWIVIHADLPLLVRGDIDALISALDEADSVIAPSSDGGTSALGGKGHGVLFSYGPGSFHRHLHNVPEARIVARPGLLHDLDTPTDLESARRHPRGGWIESVLTDPG